MAYPEMTRRRWIAAGCVAVAALLAAWTQWRGWQGQGKFEILDPARIQIVRTPGGFLQVSELRKVEDFGWRTSWECPLIDCSKLPRTISTIRVKAHYTYRIPLADEWRIEPEGADYKLTVPPVQLQAPVAFDTSSVEIETLEKSIISPAAGPNRDNALRHLGPELAQRGASLPYVNAQHQAAEQTVREFAQKWMTQQGKRIDRPIRVVFDGPNPL